MLFNADFRPSPPTASPQIMPTYEYSCQKCGQNFEAFQSMRDEPFHECPKNLCQLPKWGRGKVKRLLGTGAGLIFKGSGFYATDYRSNSYKEAAKKEAPSTRQGRLRKNQEKNPASDLEETRSQAASACVDCAVMRQPAARPLRPASPPVNQPKDRQSNAGLQADCPPETSSDWSCRTRGCVRTRESRVAFVVP